MFQSSEHINRSKDVFCVINKTDFCDTVDPGLYIYSFTEMWFYPEQKVLSFSNTCGFFPLPSILHLCPAPVPFSLWNNVMKRQDWWYLIKNFWIIFLSSLIFSNTFNSPHFLIFDVSSSLFFMAEASLEFRVFGFPACELHQVSFLFNWTWDFF